MPLLRCLLTLACLTVGLGSAQSRTVTDAAGRRVEVPDRIERVLAAGPPAAVLLYTLAPKTMIGWPRAPRPEESAFLTPEASVLPSTGRLTGRGGTANVEAVLALKPDLIVDVGSTGATYASLADRVQAQTGIPYILLDGSFSKTAETFRTLGALIGAQAEGEALAAESERILKAVAEAVATVPVEQRPRVYYGRGPRGLETGLAGSINTEIIEAAGGRNVATAEGMGGLAGISPEQVLAWNPDVILLLDPAFAASLPTDPLWSGLKAVREKRVYAAPVLPFGWVDAPPGINRLIGLRWLAGLFFPDKFTEPLPEAVRGFYRRFYHVEPSSAQIEALLSATAPLAKPR
ncbi:ABC transporter substrate-binding protein [Methylobacterium sp. Leaf456]|uniref:iron ABC transporter substrate-binding protein n=1 Tax=Methylobacterium sp. Leaf456 TaxID=1736382 RepID=UPI0006FB67EC|nr:iron ABC transporter substrate-binding protein [Methylobacterium sp. Leaf456]KQT50100.1 ABC transporter substrate-binding protein [Methylobacterium sp. Leaf456]